MIYALLTCIIITITTTSKVLSIVNEERKKQQGETKLFMNANLVCNVTVANKDSDISQSTCLHHDVH